MPILSQDESKLLPNFYPGVSISNYSFNSEQRHETLKKEKNEMKNKK